MNKSTSIKELAKALVAFQGEVGNAPKEATNPFFKSKYATLESVIETIKPVLVKNGLSFSQFPNEKGLTTILLHTSGEWLEATMELVLEKQTPQSQGSSLTYARRYALSAALGIATEDDDDGNSTNAPVALKKAPPSSVKPDHVLEDKKRIVALLKDLGKNVTKDDAAITVYGLTQLQLEEKSYADIIDRLQVLVTEKQ